MQGVCVCNWLAIARNWCSPSLLCVFATAMAWLCYGCSYEIGKMDAAAVAVFVDDLH